jgi:hypothetical protein
MLLIWSGLGALIPLAMIISGILVNISVNSIFGAHFYSSSHWTISLVLLLSALASWMIDLRVKSQKGRLLIDKETGKQILLKKKHSFFFIPVRFWPYIFVFGAVVTFIVKTFRPIS